MRSQLSGRNRQRLRTTITILVTALLVAPAAALAAHGFSDVDGDAFYHTAVDWMNDNGVTVGCNPPNNTRYCPDDPVTRGEVAVFLERLDTRNVFVRPGDDAVDGGNADMVDGMHAADFLGATDQAVDSDTVDGMHAADFLGATAKATDADNLDGMDSTAFLGATDQAVDSDTLDGMDSTHFAAVSELPSLEMHAAEGTSGFQPPSPLPSPTFGTSALDVEFTTTLPGRLHITYQAVFGLDCSEDDEWAWLELDGVPIESSATRLPPNSANLAPHTLTAVTDDVVPAGTHTVNVSSGAETCGDFTANWVPYATGTILVLDS